MVCWRLLQLSLSAPVAEIAPGPALRFCETTVAAACDVVRAVHDDYVGTWGVYGELFEHLADAHLPEGQRSKPGLLQPGC